LAEVYVKTVRRGRDLLVAACDAELLGKTLGGWRVPFVVSESFYKGRATSVEEALEAMRKATICNLVGKRIVEAAIKRGIIKESAVIYLGEVPHAQKIII
jgi:hypothetical protein